MVLCLILYKIQDYVDIKAENQELKTPRFSLYTCSHDEFTAFCLKNKVRNDRVEYVCYKKKFANVLDKTTTE